MSELASEPSVRRDLLTVRGVRKAFGELEVLRDISFDADAGGISLSLRNRDLSCTDAEALIAFGLGVARSLALEGKP